MSKIGKQPINIPAGVEIKIDGRFVIAKGPKGELKREVPKEIKVEIKEKEIIVSPGLETKRTNALWGLTRALIFNLVKGVSDGFGKRLEIQGVGYKAVLQGSKLVLSLGFSHPVEIEEAEGVKFAVEKNIIVITGPDKEKVGQVAASIRALKKPEPYKGKGIRYVGEIVRRKAGKKAVASA
jgi:large subunit ribosomal protein L6